MLRTVFAVCLLALSAACAQLPRAELQAYRDSFQAAHSAAEPLIAEYAIRERADRRARAEADPDRGFPRTGYFATFDPSDVIALSSNNRPPGASALERGFSGIAAYNDTLVGLAENRNIDEARVQLRQTVTNLTGAVSGFAPQAAVAEAPIQAAVGLIARILEPAIRQQNAEEFRRIVLDGYPPMRALIGVLRDFTPAQYSTTTRALRARWVREQENRPQIAAEINGWHRAYGDYVAVLNALESNLTALHTAVENPRAVSLLAQVTSGSAELRAYSDNLRRSIAEIRAPR